MTALEAARARASRALAQKLFERISRASLEVVEDGRRRIFGDPSAGLRAVVRVNDERAWSGLLSGGAGLAETYVDGLWDTDDITAVIRVAARNLARLDRIRSGLAPVTGPAKRLGSRVPRNTRRGARENIAAHYDLGNELFAAFLDDSMMYSAGVWPSPEATLEEAQEAKLERICERLELTAEDHLLEIGTGWGGLAIHAARTRGCHVTSATISREQRAYALERIRREGLADRIEVVLTDYRDLRGTYSKLVSIEMIEAVGWQYFDTYFRHCSELLADDGLMFLQAIVIADELYEAEKSARSFANTHVFPGGCLPSQRLIARLTERETDMRPIWLDDISADYALTLAAWRERFNAARPSLAADGYDERFGRLWNFYLAFSEAGFLERRIRDLQIVLAKPGHRPASAPAERFARNGSTPDGDAGTASVAGSAAGWS